MIFVTGQGVHFTLPLHRVLLTLSPWYMHEVLSILLFNTKPIPPPPTTNNYLDITQLLLGKDMHWVLALHIRSVNWMHGNIYYFALTDMSLKLFSLFSVSFYLTWMKYIHAKYYDRFEILNGWWTTLLPLYVSTNISKVQHNTFIALCQVIF